MRGVGVPGGPTSRGHRSTGNKAKQAEYRQSEAGRLARKYRQMDPERRALMAMKRRVKQKMRFGG